MRYGHSHSHLKKEQNGDATAQHVRHKRHTESKRDGRGSMPLEKEKKKGEKREKTQEEIELEKGKKKGEKTKKDQGGDRPRADSSAYLFPASVGLFCVRGDLQRQSG